VPDETFRAYRREGKRFEDWCASEGEVSLPCATDALTNWVADRCDAGHSVSAIKQGISAVVFFHDQANVHEKLMPDTADAWRILGAYKAERADAGHREQRAAVVDPEELRRMVATLPPGRVASLRDKAILTTGMSSYARRSNLVRFDIQDLDFLPSGDVKAKVTRSKTDQRARGRNVTMPPGNYDLSDPVGALRAWVDELARQGITDGPLYRRVSRTDRILPYRLHSSHVNTLVQRTAREAGLKPQPNTKHTAHTLRASGASAAADSGAPTALIAEQGGWTEKGTQVHIYTRSKRTDNAMRGVL
jgi:integrase